MEQLRQTIIRFQKDNLIAATRTSAVDLSFLFEKGSLGDWNKGYQLGWRGPYMTGGDSRLVDIGDAILLSGVGQPHVATTKPHQRQRAAPAPFTLATANGIAIASNPPCTENNNNNQCVFDWRFVGQ